jgi:GH15 family glucan-1,4-alpha-glucosidase
MVKRQVELAAERWDKPDRGIWASRGKPRHYTSSKVMCWVALDRGSRLAAMRGDDELQDRWTQCARDLQQDVLDNAVNDDGVFMSYYGSEDLDASVLLIPLVRFLPASDPRVKKTVLAIGEELSEHGLILRRRPHGGGDEAITGEAFVVCSFWYASALAEVGEDQEAREVCERMLTYMSPLGLYAEHLDPHTGRHLGNYPHMFTHLALVNSLLHLIRSDAAGSYVQSVAQH